MGSSRNTLVRCLHDLSAATGWARWSPANAAAIGAHLIGGA